MSTGHVAPKRSWHPWVVFGLIGGTVIVLDQASKAWVEAGFPLASPSAPAGSPGAPSPVIGDLVRIARTWNDGGVFGLIDASRPEDGPEFAEQVLMVPTGLLFRPPWDGSYDT